eukprot:812665-Pelagomonas_calceolata.AAC.1
MEALAIKTGHKRTKLRFFPLLIVVNQKAQAGCEIISSLHLRVGAQNVGSTLKELERKCLFRPILAIHSVEQSNEELLE